MNNQILYFRLIKCMQNVCKAKEKWLNAPFYKVFSLCSVLQIWLAPDKKNLEEILSSFFVVFKVV